MIYVVEILEDGGASEILAAFSDEQKAKEYCPKIPIGYSVFIHLIELDSPDKKPVILEH